MSSISSLQCKVIRQYTLLVGNVDQCLREIMRHEACTQERNVIFSKSESTVQVKKIIGNSSASKKEKKQTPADCNNARRCPARDEFLRSVGYHRFTSRYST